MGSVTAAAQRGENYCHRVAKVGRKIGDSVTCSERVEFVIKLGRVTGEQGVVLGRVVHKGCVTGDKLLGNWGPVKVTVEQIAACGSACDCRSADSSTDNRTNGDTGSSSCSKT